MGCTSSTDAVDKGKNEHPPNKEAAKWKSAGDAAFDSKKYDEAIEHYTKAAEADEKFGSPYYNRGLCYEKKGDHKLAMADLQQAQKMLCTQQALRRCADAIERVRAILPEDKAAQYKKEGDGHFDKKDWDQAFVSYTLSIEVDAEYGESYYNRGLVYEHTEDFHESLADLQKAEALMKNPHSVRVCHEAITRVKARIPKAELGKQRELKSVVVLISSLTTTTEQEREQREVSTLLTGQKIDHDVLDVTLNENKSWSGKLRTISHKKTYPQVFSFITSQSYIYCGDYKTLQTALDEGRFDHALRSSATTTTHHHPHHQKPKPPPPDSSSYSPPVVTAQREPGFDFDLHQYKGAKIWSLTEKERENLWYALDRDHSDVLNINELKDFAKAFWTEQKSRGDEGSEFYDEKDAQNHTERVLEALKSHLDKDHNGKVTKKEFVDSWNKIAKEAFSSTCVIL